ncbi:hypothetical protein [Acetobacter musti]|uniref:hypothetical protein n=1 Tax=Acetobacter musti TaxID=864732 RepID=UPI00156BBEA9|nr:hypothetical protein [Acetobacter musti]
MNDSSGFVKKLVIIDCLHPEPVQTGPDDVDATWPAADMSRFLRFACLAGQSEDA